MGPAEQTAGRRRIGAIAALVALVLALSAVPARAEPIAVAGLVVHVHAGVAELPLNCHNQPCEGVAKLVAQFPRPDGSERRAVIGRKAFAIPAETEKVLRIGLNRQGRRMMRRAKAGGRYCLLQGPGLRNRTVLLKRVRAFPPR